VQITQKKLRYEFIYERIKVRKLMELTFKYKFETYDPVRFAYCIPYTYSQLIAEMAYLRSKEPRRTQLGSLGKSLTGVDLPYLIVGPVGEDGEQKREEIPVLLCIGRLHPGESCASHVMTGLMNFVCTSSEALYIREK
jgi:hypothetical protein